jgi:hypothetical protein
LCSARFIHLQGGTLVVAGIVSAMKNEKNEKNGKAEGERGKK